MDVKWNLAGGWRCTTTRMYFKFFFSHSKLFPEIGAFTSSDCEFFSKCWSDLSNACLLCLMKCSLSVFDMNRIRHFQDIWLLGHTHCITPCFPWAHRLYCLHQHHWCIQMLISASLWKCLLSSMIVLFYMCFLLCEMSCLCLHKIPSLSLRALQSGTHQAQKPPLMSSVIG